MSTESRLRWQCRRGMKELDALMVGYLENHYPNVDPEEKAAFERVLRLSDPELIGYLLKGEQPEDPGVAAVIRRILG